MGSGVGDWSAGAPWRQTPGIFGSFHPWKEHNRGRRPSPLPLPAAWPTPCCLAGNGPRADETSAPTPNTAAFCRGGCPHPPAMIGTSQNSFFKPERRETKFPTKFFACFSFLKRSNTSTERHTLFPLPFLQNRTKGNEISLKVLLPASLSLKRSNTFTERHTLFLLPFLQNRTKGNKVSHKVLLPTFLSREVGRLIHWR